MLSDKAPPETDQQPVTVPKPDDRVQIGPLDV
jgi:hypothetical protein